MTARTAGELAAAEQKIAGAEDALRRMAATFPEGLAVHGGRTQAIGAMGALSLRRMEPFQIVLLLTTAVAVLSELGYGSAPAPDVFAAATVPAGPHAVSTVAPSADGTFAAVCVCGDVFTGTEDDAVAALDAHLAEKAGA